MVTSEKPRLKTHILLLFLLLIILAGVAAGQDLRQYTTFVIDFRSGDVLNVVRGESRGTIPTGPLKAPYVARVTGEGTAELLGSGDKRPLLLQKGMDTITFFEPFTAGYMHSITVFNHWMPKYRGFL